MEEWLRPAAMTMFRKQDLTLRVATRAGERFQSMPEVVPIAEKDLCHDRYVFSL